MRPGSCSPPSPQAQARYLQLLSGEGGAGSLGRLRLAVLLRGHSPLQRDPVAYEKEAPCATGQRLPCPPACPPQRATAARLGESTPGTMEGAPAASLAGSSGRKNGARTAAQERPRAAEPLHVPVRKHHQPRGATTELRKMEQVGGSCRE